MDGEKCHRKTHEKYEKPVRFLTMPECLISTKNKNSPFTIFGESSYLNYFLDLMNFD